MSESETTREKPPKPPGKIPANIPAKPAAKSMRAVTPPAGVPALLFTDIEARLRGRPLVVMLDIDGTLCDIAQTPDDALVSGETREILQQLVRTPDVHVALITGRSVADALRLVGIEGVHVYGNHGIEVANPAGVIEIDSVARDAEVALRGAVAALRPVVQEQPGALLEDKRYTLSLHYRTAPRDTVRTLRKTVNDVAKKFGLQVTEGSCVLELRPPHAADKGRAVLRLANELGANTADASILFAGDDVTDEDAFRALRARLPHAVTISIGYRVASTSARYRLDDPGALQQLLAQLLARRIFFARGTVP